MNLRRVWAMVAAFLTCVPAAGPTLAAAPAGRYTVSDGTVKDNRTGLLWQQSVDAGMYTQTAAVTLCNGLSLGGYASGWRLPTIAELLSIVDVTAKYPAIDSTAFPRAPSFYFWTASPYVYVGSPDNLWIVDFGDGGSSQYPASNSIRVRCVR